ncbi:diguanylate cyclase [Martelella endophytica]|uniref:diguanylate cyclase n=1 Tax=Martelella endophytica TaxID=1486262 RepID=UPI0006964A22|nr:diguanylate cyclase [Martelella endophytica]
METARQIVESMLSGLGLISIIVIVFTVVLRLSGTSRPSPFWLGIVFGVGAIAGMVHPSELAPGILIDSRAVMVALAAPFGGPVAAIVAMSMAAAVRAFLGGVGAYAGIAGILIVGLVGIVHARIFTQRRDLVSFSILGFASTIHLLALALLPPDLAMKVLLSAAPYLVGMDFLGIVLLGIVLSLELKYRNNLILLQTAAEIDPLTRLANRRALERFSGKIRGRAESDRIDFSVIMFDIDHFKSVNDRFGHQIGDMVLEEVSRVIVTHVRKADLVVRYGGEEIAAVLPASTWQATMTIAETIRAKVEETVFIHHGHRIQLTISAGISTSHDGNTDFEAVLKEADLAVYDAKQYGRNRVEVYGRSEVSTDRQSA